MVIKSSHTLRSAEYKDVFFTHCDQSDEMSCLTLLPLCWAVALGQYWKYFANKCNGLQISSCAYLQHIAMAVQISGSAITVQVSCSALVLQSRQCWQCK